MRACPGHGDQALAWLGGAQQSLQLGDIAREVFFGLHPVTAQGAHGQWVGARGAAQAQVDAAGVELGQRAKGLCYHQRRMVGQHDAARAHPDAFGSPGQMPHQHGGSRTGDALHIVVLGDPVAHKAQTLGVLHCLARHVQGLGDGMALAHGHQVKHGQRKRWGAGHGGQSKTALCAAPLAFTAREHNGLLSHCRLGVLMHPSPSSASADPSATAASAVDQAQLALLRAHRRAHRRVRPLITQLPLPTPSDPPPLTRGQRLADGVAATIGSWRFIVIQSTAIVLWISGNVWFGAGSWDPYPFILLNLLLSFQAAYTAPAIMMSQNRQSELDRRHAQNDYEINVKAELEIELLHEKIDILKERELLALTEAVRQLSQQLDALSHKLR